MEIFLSVRGLVEFLLRSGDIDNRRGGDSEKAMAEGARLHRKLQSGMGAFYRAEYALSETVEYENYRIIIDGRADGVILEKEGKHAVIDEIKCTYTELDRIAEPVPVHLAQAKVYAYIYAKQNAMEEIGVRMTYCNIDSEQVKYFTITYRFTELSEWFFELMEDYRKWADFTYSWTKRRNETIGALSFPFSYREGQKQLVGYVYQSVLEKKKLFIQASTGVGKTISTIYPVLKAMGEGRLERIFYLTAKTVTGTVARETYALLRERGLSFKSLTITAKEKICPMDEANCNSEYCPFAKGHYDRINDAVYDLLTKKDCYDRDTVAEYALEHQVCPFEMSLDMSLFSDGVICDYNYLFDPYAYLRRFFGEGGGAYAFLIDEAHNLVDRGREMYSAVLYKKTLVEFIELVAPHSRRMVSLAERCNQEMYSYMTDEDYYIKPSVGSFVMLLDALVDAISFYLQNNEHSPIRDEILNYYFTFQRFLETSERLDRQYYVVYCGYDEEEEFFIKEFCVDPSRELAQCMSRGVCSVLFSATFLPIQYYKALLGGDEEDYEAYAESHFPKERQLQLIAEDVTSKYTRRDEREYRKIAKYIHEVLSVKKGNYMVFFPSHAFMEQVRRQYDAMYYKENDVRILMQESFMDESAREEFLDEFVLKPVASYDGLIQMEVTYDPGEGDENAPDAGTLVGFCVMGGIFAEGIDLKEDSLIGVVVVGTGLPQVCAERNILKEHFDGVGKNGFDYAYRYPGMNKVLQAAGRVIRTDKDAGVIVLLDERFLQTGYPSLFPIEWKQQRVVSLEDIKTHVLRFWNRVESASDQNEE